MPGAWRVHAIESYLKSRDLVACVEESDIYSLPAGTRHDVLDAVVLHSAAFPMVLVNGAVACHSGIDLARIGEAARTGR